MTELHPAVRRALADAGELAASCPQLDRALTELARATSPLHAGAGGIGGPGDYGDPTPAALGLTTRPSEPDHGPYHPPPDHGATRRHTIRLLEELHSVTVQLRGVVNEWAPKPPGRKQADIDNAGFWCRNHLTYGMTEPRREDGGHYCRWCADVLSNYGRLPTSGLLKLRAQGRRLSESDFKREIGTKRKHTT